MTRLRAKYGAAEARAILSREAAETEKAADANSTPLGRENDDQKKRAASFFPALPAAGAAEWWDAALLSDGKSYGAEVLREKITLYVEHPVPLPPPAGAPRRSSAEEAGEAEEAGTRARGHAGSFRPLAPPRCRWRT